MELKLVAKDNGGDASNLLIVPYGIETFEIYQGNKLKFTFNRTLWN